MASARRVPSFRQRLGAVDDNGLLPRFKDRCLRQSHQFLPAGARCRSVSGGHGATNPGGSQPQFTKFTIPRATHKPETDITSVGFIFAKKPLKVLHMTSISSQMFLVPAGNA